ncbi:MAG TPA: hypothetical protein VLK89_07400 [Solirubrobacterales bacterium]|nr:hypothetical protein [Solirubrobacterales bacterium]
MWHRLGKQALTNTEIHVWLDWIDTAVRSLWLSQATIPTLSSRRFRMIDMRADYDSTANAISIALDRGGRAEQADQVHSRAVVALRDSRPIELQLLYPDLGIEEPVLAVAARYGLDWEALVAAAQAALAAPDRTVTLAVAVRSAA